MGEQVMSREELAEMLTRAEKNLVQEAAADLVPLAIRTLKQICKSTRKASASARVAAAKTILDEAVGRPAVQKPSAPQHIDRGITVNIISVTGSTEQHVIDVGEVADADSRDAAQRIIQEARAAKVPGVQIASFSREKEEVLPPPSESAEDPEMDPDEPW